MTQLPVSSETERSPEGPIGYSEVSIHASLTYMQIEETDYFVIGGANLVVRRLLSSTPDLDLMVSQEVFDWMATLDGASYQPPTLSSPDRGKNTVTLWLYNQFTPIPISATTKIPDGDKPISFESHKDRVEIIDGIPCLLIEEIVALKTSLDRERDRRDLKLIDGHLSPKSSSSDSNEAIPLSGFGYRHIIRESI